MKSFIKLDRLCYLVFLMITFLVIVNQILKLSINDKNILTFIKNITYNDEER